MGEVYLARDTKLKREVAIKFLPEALRADPERLRRFRTEAEAAAKLNHPSIATIHSIEELADNGSEVTFITMEYVDGETLGSRIGKTGLELDAFFDWFLPLSDALAHAHEMGRIHRDLKPANIMIRKDGTPKILDFGLARIETGRETSEDSEAPTKVGEEHPADAPPSLTQAGALVGTPAYMSPEQIEAKTLDARTDVFSLGVVMYEALTGERPFQGSTVESIIARILEVEPEPITTLKPVTPQALWSRIRRCLKKDRGLRLPSARILYDELRDVRAELEVAPAIATPSHSVGRAVALAAVVALATGALVARVLQSAPSAPRVRKWEIALPPTGQTFGDSVASISPDGKKLVYTQRNSLWIRDFDRLESREIAGTEDGLYAFWSPGSDAIGYFNETGLHTVSVDGGPSLHVSEMTLTRFGGGGGVWTADETILISAGTRSGIVAVSLHGGASESFWEPGDGVLDFHSPSAIPNGRGVLVAAHMEASSTTDEIMLHTGQGDRSVVRHPGEWIHGPVYAPSGHVVYERGLDRAEIWAVPFSIDELAAVGNPFRVADRGRRPTVSDDGMLVYVRGGYLKQLVWVDLQGRVMDTIGQSQNSLSNPSLAPDGLRVAAIAGEGRSLDLWLHDTVRNTKERLTNDIGLESTPTWSSDGRGILFTKSGAIHAVADDTSEGVRELVRGSNPSSSRDGRFLVYEVRDPESRRDLWYQRVGGESSDPVAWLSSPYNEGAPQFSPDGAYVAYVSDQSGKAEVYVTDFPAQQNRALVSTSGGAHPRFSPRGDALFYLEGNRLMRVRVSTGAELQVAEPEALFSDGESGITLASVRGTFDSPPYDVHPDGDRFVVIRAADEAVIVVVENWAREFAEAQPN